MGIDTDILAPDHWEAALAALDWQVELGVADWVMDDPVDRYALPERLTPAPKAAAAPAPVTPTAADPVAEAAALAQAAPDLEALRAALLDFPHCELKKGTRNTVFGHGTPGARVMILTEAPTREEDQEGRPFTGRMGMLFDRMFDAIGLSREGAPEHGLWIAPVLPWRPPADRDPEAQEIAMLRPFLERHVALANPDVLVLMGNAACRAVLGQTGILRLRGIWGQAWGKPVLPMLHPLHLMSRPAAKREAWADLLSLKARL